MNKKTEREGAQDEICSELGAALASAREKAKLTQADIAERLKVTGWIIEVLEQGDWRRLGPSVYCRGYLYHYGRLVDVDVSSAEPYFDNQVQPEPTQVLPAPRRSQWLPYQRLATYAAATALIAVPAAWLIQSMLSTTPQNADRPIVGSESSTLTLAAPAPESQSQPSTPDQQPEEVVAPVFVEAEPIPTPVMASMSRMPGNASTAADQDADQDAASRSLLELRLSEDAWLEIENLQGDQLAFGLMKADSVHRFPTRQGLKVRVGNADAVLATLDGAPFDLAAHTSRDLAKFDLPSAESDQ